MARRKKQTTDHVSILQVQISFETRALLESLISPQHRTLKSIVVEGIALVHAQQANKQVSSTNA